LNAPPGMNFVPKTHHDPYPYIDPLQYSLSGKSVLITGASKGVGKAVAIGYARAGASRIALAARSSVPVDEVLAAANSANRPKPIVLALKMDVTNRESVEAAAKEVESAFGGELDILINNAGYLSKFANVAESDPDEWWLNYEANVKGTYLTCRSLVPLILKSKTKTIVNLSSAGAFGLRPGASGYQPTKLWVLRFSEFLCAEYGSEGLLAYSVHPGGVMTELGMNMPVETHKVLLVDAPELSGETFPWLTKERRDWLAGRYVSVTWDMQELEKRKDEIVKGDLLKVRMAVALGQ
jgi:NAD(P)-dependent dehydrogenase (short-subunit alcohol dehydrogenase family)